MKYSFVVIAYNEELNITSCIQSIVDQKGIGNSYEIIVVDDGSNDKTAKLVNEYSHKNSKVKLVSDGVNRGRGYARYTGVASSTGQLIAMVDGDIILPSNWLLTCSQHINDSEAVGGIPVPDGDIAFIFNRFNLKPKIVMTSTTITGSNGLYKREIFQTLNFDQSLRNGEDVDFNHKMVNAKYRGLSLADLVVTHKENISFNESINWLYQSGKGATRQLKTYKKLRLPDLAYFGLLVCIIIAAVLTSLTGLWVVWLLPLLYPLFTSFLHIQKKFYYSFSTTLGYVAAVVANFPLIISYYIGRTKGWIIT